MTRLANARTYRSELRAQQADETRSRILDATVRVMARGVASVSVPGVAREAGVSVPTVYRHFGSKQDLLASVYPHLVRRAGLDEIVGPRSIDELSDGIHELFERIDRLSSGDELARAAMAGPAAEEARHLSIPQRMTLSRRLADTITPTLRPADRDRIARVMVVLTTSSAFRTWREHLGVSVDVAADDVVWTIRAAVAAATGGDR